MTAAPLKQLHLLLSLRPASVAALAAARANDRIDDLRVHDSDCVAGSSVREGNQSRHDD